MKKDIYKITNIVDGKIYIGQSVNPARRFKEHFRGKRDGSTSVIHNAMQKYGVDAFKLEIIERDVEDYNEREKYWISYYNSNDRDVGYNITAGGEDPPILYGPDCALYKFDDSTIRKICKTLRDTNLSYNDICKMYDISDVYVQHINVGKARRLDGFQYPIRNHINTTMSPEIVESVENYLNNTTESIEEIARIHGIDSNTIYDINDGTHKNSTSLYEYPIRDQYKRLSKHMVQLIKGDLESGMIKMSAIESKYNTSHCTVSRINQGKIYNDTSRIYPIRKSSERVY